MEILKRIFGQETEKKERSEESENTYDIRIAACALLLEMANIDGEFSGTEKENIVAIVKREFGLSDETVNELITASEKELNDSVDLWQFASTINRQYSLDEKMRVMEMVWQVVYADGHLDQHEDYLARKVSRLLRLSHAQLIEAKLNVLGKS